eukprot:g20054.t1
MSVGFSATVNRVLDSPENFNWAKLIWVPNFGESARLGENFRRTGTESDHHGSGNGKSCTVNMLCCSPAPAPSRPLLRDS